MKVQNFARKAAWIAGCLSISAFLVVTTAMQATGGTYAKKDIVDTAVSAGSFKTL